MILAAEFTTTTLVVWVVMALVVGLVLGWLLRPWLIRDRLATEYEAKLDQERSARGEADAKLTTTADQLATVRVEVDSARADVVRLGADLGAANTRVWGLKGSIESLAMEKDAEIQRLDTQTGRTSELERAVADRDARIAELEAGVGSAGAESAALSAKVADAERAVAEMRTEQASYGARLAEKDVRIAELVAAAAAAALRAPKQTPVVAEPTALKPVPDKDTAARKVAEIAVRTRGDGARVMDDLKRVHGIGPKIDRLLKEMDITSFKQIANFEADDIAYVAAALESFPDRIQRDDWMTSAARLHEERYGEAV